MIYRTPKQAEDDAIALRARVAQLEEALREQLGYTPGGPCQLPLIPKCICEKCKNDRARAALSGSSSDWLEAVKREAIVAELTRMANMGDEQIAALAAVIQRQDHKLAMWRDTFEAIDEDDMEASAHNALSAVYDLTDDAEAQDAADSILASLKQRMKAEGAAEFCEWYRDNVALEYERPWFDKYAAAKRKEAGLWRAPKPSRV